MITLIEPKDTTTLDDYGAHSYLAPAVKDLRNTATEVRHHINGRSILMVNSTSQGGGVAEMLPKLMGMLGALGIDARWVVMGSEDPAFFRLTKRIHNMIHGDGGGDNAFTPEDRTLFEFTAESNLEALRALLKPEDLVVVHDPQPLAMGAMLKDKLNLPAVWRCHIGLDKKHPANLAAWDFLKPYIRTFDHGIFSADEYAPDYIRDRASVIYPAIDPLSAKNFLFRPEQLASILTRAGLAKSREPSLEEPYSEKAQRLQPDGTFGPAGSPNEIGFLYRPTVTQISRWDRLKGFQPLLEGFIKLKMGLGGKVQNWDKHHQLRVEALRLVMVGPDPASIQDDPEGCDVMNELCATYMHIDSGIQKDVALVTLPMNSRKENALMVNAIQASSSIVVQNSIREGFGLTLTEAMWKGAPVIGTSACGLRQQIRDRIHGRVIDNPEDPEEVARVLGEMICADREATLWSRNAQARVHQEFLIFNQVKKWLQILKQFGKTSFSIRSKAREDNDYSSVGHMDRMGKVHFPIH